MLFQNFVQVFYHVLPPLLRERRNRDANHLAIVHRVQSELRGADRLFDCSHRRWIKGLHGNQLRLGSVHLRNLVQRHLRSVVVHTHTVEHVYRGASGPRGRHRLAEIFDRLVHPRLELNSNLSKRPTISHGSAPLNFKIKTLNYKPNRKSGHGFAPITRILGIPDP